HLASYPLQEQPAQRAGTGTRFPGRSAKTPLSETAEQFRLGLFRPSRPGPNARKTLREDLPAGRALKPPRPHPQVHRNAIAPRVQLPFPCPRSIVDGPCTGLTGRAPCLLARPARVNVDPRLLDLHLVENPRLQPQKLGDNLLHRR